MIINRPASSEDTARLRKIKRVMENRQEGIIVLENIADPHNAAAVWRTAEAFGFQKIYLVYSKEKAINPKKIGKASSASANKWLSFTTFRNTDECYKKLHKDGYKIYATVIKFMRRFWTKKLPIFNLQTSIFKKLPWFLETNTEDCRKKQ